MQLRRIVLFIVIGVSAGAFMSACSKHDAPGTAFAVTGTLNYRAPVAFDGNAKLELQLTDVSVTTGPALQVASTTIDQVRALPYHYSLPYDSTRIDPGHRYTMSARLYLNEQLKYATDTAIAALTQGAGQHINIPLVAVGANESSVSVAAVSSTATAASEVFQGELHNAAAVVRYRAGFDDGHIAWLEEDRLDDGSQPAHARYEFKGALLLHYADSSGLEFACNDNGRPVSVSRNHQTLAVMQALPAINAARNRATLLRSHALSSREIKAHRIATKQDVTG